MIRRATATINLSALKHNFSQVQSIAGKRNIVAMIKANAYGHGVLPIAESLKEANAFGLACLDEAIALRQAGVDKPLWVMSGFQTHEELMEMIAHRLTLVVHDIQHIEILQSYRGDQRLDIKLKIDTGMHRLGIYPEQFKKALEALNTLPFVQKPITLITHLADADNNDQSFSKKQLNAFNQLIKDYSGPVSVSNSATILNYPDQRDDFFRPGIMLYGASPITDQTGLDINLKPVMTLRSKIIAKKRLMKGDTVGYGCRWVCPEDNREIAIVAIGYGDGYPRQAKDGTPVLINDVICPMAGRVSMDMITVDITNNPSVMIGDEAILWGEGLPIEWVARHADTISYELLTNVTKRVRYEYAAIPGEKLCEPKRPNLSQGWTKK